MTSLSWLAGRLPLSAALTLGRGLGRLMALTARRRGEVLNRLERSLGVDRREAVRIRRRMYLNLGMTVMETLRLPHMSEEEIRAHVSYEGAEKAPPRGEACLALVAHTGNWEMNAAANRLFLDTTLNVVVKKLKPESLNRWLNTVRTRFGTRMVDRRGSVREILKVIRRGEVLGFVLDQNTKRNWGVFVDFFGQPACTSDGLSQIAAMTGVWTYPVFCRRLADHSLLVRVGDPLPPPASREEEEIRKHTQCCTRIIEEFVRAYPDQWIWMHRRWRTQPKAKV